MTQAQSPSGLSGGNAALVFGLAVVLIAGFIVLSALGRDTTGYLLFLGGPAVTGVVGALLSRRVAVVSDQVAATQHQATAAVAAAHTALDDHLSVQDETLGQLAAAVDVVEHPATTTAQQIPGARVPPAVSPFGPVRAGLFDQR